MEQESLNVYRGCTPVVDAEYESGSDVSPTEVIIEALAEAAGIDPIELPPLYEFVDPDALDHLFGEHDGAAHADALLSFQVETWNVFVRADGCIRVCDNTQPTEPEPVFESTPV
ncbi:HalOD1 output domain-containing protein [Natronomonas gomsonensis]|uniref:HalOD1 output domain-containing protein n=1 Tax=Natronomonas gomsonensis TaxID=1046043 RepID=UPI0015BCE826|nr:HalOD1 output domain-containing protein [Natronomonas gomsonensis]